MTGSREALPALLDTPEPLDQLSTVRTARDRECDVGALDPFRIPSTTTWDEHGHPRKPLPVLLRKEGNKASVHSPERTGYALPGLGVAAYAKVHYPNAARGPVRAPAPMFAALTVVLMLVGWRDVRAVPSVHTEVPEQTAEPLRYAIIRTGTAMAMYWLACVLFAGVLWRGARGS